MRFGFSREIAIFEKALEKALIIIFTHDNPLKSSMFTPSLKHYAVKKIANRLELTDVVKNKAFKHFIFILLKLAFVGPALLLFSHFL